MKTYYQLLEIIPCETEKCLVYPSCKNKHHIDCTLLRDFFVELHESVRDHEFTTKLQTDKIAWKVMHEKFENLHAICIDKTKGSVL